jgi:hypothetical protein
MSIHSGASAFNGGVIGASAAHHQTNGGLQNWDQPSRSHNETWDAMETYFECITTCSLDDGECVTRCVEQLRQTA